MSGVPSVSVEEARGRIALPSEIDSTCMVIGTSSAGSGLSPFFANVTAAIAAVGYGDGPDVLTQIIERTQKPAALYTLPVDTAGSYGAIDVTGITGAGTMAVDGAVIPRGTYEAYVEVVNPFTVGVTGGTIRWSLDRGRNKSRIYAVGTATSYTIPNAGVKIDFSPSGTDLTALNTLLNELKTDYEAHRVVTAGGVHGIADATNTITAANASSTPTRIALANDLRAKYSAHRILTAGGVHGAVDGTNVLVAPVATDDTSALTLALDLKAKYNAHHILTAGAVHGLADPGNTTAAAAPASGTFNAGDFAVVRTFAPLGSTDDIDDAFAALAQNSTEFALVCYVGATSAAIAGHLKTGVATLKAVGKRVSVICATRMPDFEASETEAAWMASIEADFAAFESSFVHVRAGYGYVTDAVTSREYMRPDLAEFMADVVRVPRITWPCSPNDRALEGVQLADSDGNLIGHDEGPMGTATGLSDDDQGQRFGCDFRGAQPSLRASVFTCVPWVMYAPDERILNLMVRRIANAIERTASAVAFSALGGTTFYTPADGPNVAMLTESGRNRIHAAIYARLAQDFHDEIQNPDDANPDTGLVQVESEVTVSGGNLITAAVILAPLVLGYLLKLNITLAIQE